MQMLQEADLTCPLKLHLLPANLFGGACWWVTYNRTAHTPFPYVWPFLMCGQLHCFRGSVVPPCPWLLPCSRWDQLLQQPLPSHLLLQTYGSTSVLKSFPRKIQLSTVTLCKTGFVLLITLGPPTYKPNLTPAAAKTTYVSLHLHLTKTRLCLIGCFPTPELQWEKAKSF